MPLYSPVSVLFDSEGVELSVSQSQEIPSNQPGIFAVGSGSQGATFFKVADNGSLFITGSLSTSVSFPVTQSVTDSPAPTTTLSSAIASTTAFEILAENSNRKQAILYVDGKRNWFVGLGATPTTSLFSVKLGQLSFWEVPERYTGTISVIADGAGQGTLMITEITY